MQTLKYRWQVLDPDSVAWVHVPHSPDHVDASVVDLPELEARQVCRATARVAEVLAYRWRVPGAWRVVVVRPRSTCAPVDRVQHRTALDYALRQITPTWDTEPAGSICAVTLARRATRFAQRVAQPPLMLQAGAVDGHEVQFLFGRYGISHLAEWIYPRLREAAVAAGISIDLPDPELLGAGAISFTVGVYEARVSREQCRGSTRRYTQEESHEGRNTEGRMAAMLSPWMSPGQYCQGQASRTDALREPQASREAGRIASAAEESDLDV